MEIAFPIIGAFAFGFAFGYWIGYWLATESERARCHEVLDNYIRMTQPDGALSPKPDHDRMDTERW